MRERLFGATWVECMDGPQWYVIITPPNAAVCGRHGRPHLHRHPVRGHPAHRPPMSLAADLTLEETIRRLDVLCTPMRRGPSVQELLEVLA